MPDSWITRPVRLDGRFIRLEPLGRTHLAALCEVGLDEELWRWTVARVRTIDEMRAYIEAAITARVAGTAYPFAIVELGSGRVVGSTRFGNIDRANRRLEIGWSWIGRPWQRTPINTEAKYLMLRFAFEELECLRVELKTDALNARSRTAIARIGAKEEGTLRSHVITASGRVRDTVYYSIIAAEWPGVRTALEAKLRRPFEFRRPDASG
ncbi:MAG TPA: GNAT family protein [Longimicrobiales bacterium]